MKRRISCKLTTSEVSELSRPWAKVAPFRNRVEDTPRSVATVKRSGISDPVDFDTLLLQGEEHHESGNRDSA